MLPLKKEVLKLLGIKGDDELVKLTSRIVPPQR